MQRSNTHAMNQEIFLDFYNHSNSFQKKLIESFTDTESYTNRKNFDSFWKEIKSEFMHKAVKLGLVNLVDALIKLDRDLLEVKKYYSQSNYPQLKQYFRTPLCTAVKNEQINMTELLLRNGCEVNVTSNWETPLHTASSVINNKVLVELLLQYGANVHALNHKGETALQALMNRGFSFPGTKDCLAKLIAYGDDVYFWYKAHENTNPFLTQYLILKSLLRDAQQTKPKNMIDLVKALLDAYINPAWYSLTHHTKKEEAQKLLDWINKKNPDFEVTKSKISKLLLTDIMNSSTTFKAICLCILQPEFQYYLDAVNTGHSKTKAELIYENNKIKADSSYVINKLKTELSHEIEKSKFKEKAIHAHYYNIYQSPVSIFFRCPELLNNILLFLDIKSLSAACCISQGFYSTIFKFNTKNVVAVIEESNQLKLK